MKKIMLTLTSILILSTSIMASEIRITSSDKKIDESIKIVNNEGQYSFYSCQNEECLSLLNKDEKFNTADLNSKVSSELAKSVLSTAANIGPSFIGSTVAWAFLKTSYWTNSHLFASIVGMSVVEASILDALNPFEHVYSALVLKAALQEDGTEVNNIREFKDTLREVLEEI